MSESIPYVRGHNHSPSYNSAETGGSGLNDPHANTVNLSTHSPPDSPDLSKSSLPRGVASSYDSARAPGGEFGSRFDVQKVGRAIVARVVRAARRGNLPFLVIFFSCLVFFFSALAGIGYVDPETLPSTGSSPSIPNAPVQFIPGVPIFDPNENSEIAKRRKHEERRELEKEWQKMKRPKDGAWMRKQRDDKAVRRVAIKPPEPAHVEMYKEEKEDLVEVAKRDLVEEEGWTGMAIQEEAVKELIGQEEAYNEPTISDEVAEELPETDETKDLLADRVDTAADVEEGT